MDRTPRPSLTTLVKALEQQSTLVHPQGGLTCEITPLDLRTGVEHAVLSHYQSSNAGFDSANLSIHTISPAELTTRLSSFLRGALGRESNKQADELCQALLQDSNATQVYLIDISSAQGWIEQLDVLLDGASIGTLVELSWSYD